MITITTRIPKDLYEMLKKQAAETERSISQLIRKSLKDLVNKNK